jgi:hypothetical protein
MAKFYSQLTEELQTSCGYGVPIYEFQEQRQTLIDWAKRKGKEGIKKYWQENNQKSIDGLPVNIPNTIKKKALRLDI